MDVWKCENVDFPLISLPLPPLGMFPFCREKEQATLSAHSHSPPCSSHPVTPMTCSLLHTKGTCQNLLNNQPDLTLTLIPCIDADLFRSSNMLDLCGFRHQDTVWQ